MSFKEVMKLREKEELNEAYSIASEDLARAMESEDQDSIYYAKIALGWVYYDYLEIAISKNSHSQILKCLSKIVELDLETEEKYLSTAIAWEISKYLFQYRKTGKDLNKRYLKKLTDKLTNLHFKRPSKEYSVLLNAVESVAENWYGFLDFVDWWDLKYLRNADCDFYRKGGEKYDSLAEKVLSQYSRLLLQGKKIDQYEGKKVEKERVKAFLPRLSTWIEKYPEYDFLPYYKSKMHLFLDDKPEGRKAFLPFARENNNAFWVWNHMAELSENTDKKMKYLAKSLDLVPEQNKSINIRLSLAEELLRKEKFAEAKREVDKAYSITVENDYREKDQLKNYRHSQWYKNTGEIAYDEGVYKEWSAGVEDVLYEDLESTLAVITHVNREKRILNYASINKELGFFSYRKKLNSPHVGDLIRFRMKSRNKDGFTTFYTLEKSAEKNRELRKKESGNVKILGGGKYGFIGNVFISAATIKEFNIEDNTYIEGEAHLSYDRTKDEWGWELFKVSEDE